MSRSERFDSILCAVVWTAAIVLLLPAPAHGENSLFTVALDSITVDELYEHVNVLADDTLEGRAAGSRGGHAAARYIETRLEGMKVAPAGEGGRNAQPFYGSYRNILARIDGGDDALADEWIVVGAHFDHVGYGSPQNSNGPIGYIHNGADDNASGVAALLETIEAFTKLGEPPRRSILFAFWDGEEQGLLGSRHWVNEPTVPLSAVRLSINSDMVGRLRKGRLEVGGTRSGFGLRQLLASRTLPEGMWLSYDWELKENSDHWPFFQRDIPVVLLHTGMHEDYHRPSDDVERVNRDGMRDVAAYLFDVVYRAANADELPRYRSAGRTESPFTQRQRERRLRPAPPRLGIAFRDVSEMQPSNDAPIVDGTPPSPDAREFEQRGVVVTKVEPGSPADAAGLVVGDHIVGIGGQDVTEERRFQQLVQIAPAETQLAVVRASQMEPLAIDVQLNGIPTKLGITWWDDPAEPGAVYLTRVNPGSLAAVSGLRVHDRIYDIDGASYEDRAAFGDLLNERLDVGAPFSLTVERFGRVVEVEIQPIAAPANWRDR